MNISIEDAVKFFGALLGLISLIIAVLEYQKQGIQKRSAFFSNKLEELWLDDHLR